MKISLAGIWTMLLIFGGSISSAHAQCGVLVSTFPYNQGFESGTAGWTASGSNSDWAWGTPAHPTINSAANGTKAWCLGGLTGSAYNGSQGSFLYTPCFDFTNLDYPWISFNIFWETEHQYDGMVLQYSLNGGSSWTNLGAYNDPVNCLNDHWFNYNNISWLTLASTKHGWSGRIGPTQGSCKGGSGSAGWVNAKHCMSALAHEPNVKFRFYFGSGTTCNAYDGIAIDDFVIQNAPTFTADFTYTCSGPNQVDFTNTSDACNNVYSWNFGDPTSSANTSTFQSPFHTFSGPGTYTVSLTTSSSCNEPTTVTKTVTILSANVSSTDVSCHGGMDGTATVQAVSGASYQWNTNPVQTGTTANDLTAGTYTVTVTKALACSATASITVNEPDELTSISTSSASCTDLCNGSVGITVSGGTSPYSYSWAALGTSQNITGTVCVGTYLNTLTDANGCQLNTSVTVGTLDAPDVQCAPANVCVGSSAILNATGAVDYFWSPPTGLNTTTGASVLATPAITTVYLVTGISADGCSATIDVLVSVNNELAPVSDFTFLPNPADVYHPEVNFTNTTTGADTYVWLLEDTVWNYEVDNSYSFPTDSGGHYNVCLIAANDLGCTDTICKEVQILGFLTAYVPDAFSPNGDGYNEFFYPVLRDVPTKDFQFQVFNRWGQMVFESETLEDSWDGSFHGEACPVDTYVWKLQYFDEEDLFIREVRGTVSLLR